MDKDKSPVKVDTELKDNTQEQNLDLLSLLGIKIEDSKIEIDTNATKSFFEGLQQKVQKSLEEIESGVKEGKIDLKESVGVKVDESKIEIDLDKAKNFLDQFTNKVQEVVTNIDKTVSEFVKK